MKDRLAEIVCAVQEQHHSARMTRIQSEVPGLLVFQPNGARRSEAALVVPRFYRSDLNSVVHFGDYGAET